MNDKDFHQSCPVCNGNCNCINCLRKKGPSTVAFFISFHFLFIPKLLCHLILFLIILQAFKFNVMHTTTDDICHNAKYILKFILPSMTQIYEEQNNEKIWEAKVQGISLSLSVTIFKACFGISELSCMMIAQTILTCNSIQVLA